MDELSLPVSPHEATSWVSWTHQKLPVPNDQEQDWDSVRIKLTK